MGPPTRYGNGHSPVLIKYTVGTHFRECELSLHSFFFVLTSETESFFFLESSFSALVVLKLQSRQLNSSIYRAHSTDFSN